MTENQDQEIYLAKAKEADEMAAQATAPHIRDTWLKIAKNYRDMANFEIKGSTGR